MLRDMAMQLLQIKGAQLKEIKLMSLSLQKQKLLNGELKLLK